MEEITINLKKISDLVAEGEDIFIKPEAEDALIELLEIQEKVEEAVKTVKENLEAKGLEINPNFKSIQGDNVRIGYRYFGAEYRIDEAYISEIPENLYTAKTSYSLDTKELKNYLKENKGIPQGIVANDRKKTITISIKGGAND